MAEYTQIDLHSLMILGTDIEHVMRSLNRIQHVVQDEMTYENIVIKNDR
jgi:hypothetical protein